MEEKQKRKAAKGSLGGIKGKTCSDWQNHEDGACEPDEDRRVHGSL